ncbi:MAG TPA: LysR family transcriptional regulator [Burkholderiales bacterium]|jgi:DNA-binding transcriptional LysR family regulator
MDKLRAMAGFVRIVDKGSLTAAAAELGISLPSMVRTLAALERELGATLLNRTTRRINLTDEGRQYLEQCRSVLAQVQEAEAKLLSRRTTPRGRLAVTASVLFGRNYVAPLVSEFLQRHPEVSAELLFVDRVVNLVEEGVDAAIRIGRLADSSLAAIPLGEMRRVVCASPAYLRSHGVPRRPEELRAHRCVRFTGLAPHAEWVFRSPARKVAIASVMTCNQADAAIEACAAGLGLGAFFSYMVAPLVRAGRLRYVLEEFEVDAVPVTFLYPQSRMLSPTVRAFADLCAKKLRATRFD